MNKSFKIGIALLIISIILISIVTCLIVNSTKIFAVQDTEQHETPETPVVQIVEVEPVIPATNEEINLLALVTMAEAEGECVEGKRLVIDTILNRVDHPRFPDSIYKVVYQKNQFTSMWNGRVKRCYVREDLRKLVIEELLNRTNSEVVFFRTGRYSSYGKPVCRVGSHYFSKY